jgi:hypothetical protein
MSKNTTTTPKTPPTTDRVWTPIVKLDLDTASASAFDEVVGKLAAAAKEAKEAGDLPDLDFETGVVTMTPQLAESCLLRNAGNRKVRLPHVKRLSKIMLNGGWKLAQPLLWDGSLEEGQHRLWAVYLSGATIDTTLMVVPKQEQLFAVIDTGKGRSASDALYTAGSNGQSVAVAQAVSLLWRYDIGGLGISKQPKVRAMENIEVLNYAKERPEITSTAHLIAGSHPRAATVIGHKGVAVAFGYMLVKIFDEDALNEFYAPLGSGANLRELDPILALRDRLTRVGEDDEKMDAPHRLALMIRAFDLHRKGLQVSRTKGLYLRDNEKYPRLEAELPIAAE